MSIQSKRGSAHGLVNYIANSKIDPSKERPNGRELFNDFSSNLSLESANNSLKVALSKTRVGNDQLHHLVISFKESDYKQLARSEKERQTALKSITRASVDGLREYLRAEKLSWVAALHLNTDNPHVHIALQKEYISKSFENCRLTQIPKDAIPHYEIVRREKVFVPGIVAHAAEVKMESVLAQEQVKERNLPLLSPDLFSHASGNAAFLDEPRGLDRNGRRTLGKAIIGEALIRRIEAQIEHLAQNGDKMKFLVTDSSSGEKRRLSLSDLDRRRDKRSEDARMDENPEARIIKTVLFKMMGKQENQKTKVEKEFGTAIEVAKKIRSHHRKQNLRLPTPILSKTEIDQLQEQCLETSDIRRFAYLEKVRTENEREGEIEGRNQHDLSRIFAQKAIANLRVKNNERQIQNFDTGRFYRRVDLDGKSLSLADVEREQTKQSIALKLVEDIQHFIGRLTCRDVSREDLKTNQLLQDIELKLDESKRKIAKEYSGAKKQSKLLEKILESDRASGMQDGKYLPHELDEIERLAARLGLREVYQENWSEQRSLIDSARADCPAARRLSKSGDQSDFECHKQEVIGGRAIAKEIVAKIRLDMAKEDLDIFRKKRQYTRFPVSGSRPKEVNYLSLKEVDLPNTHSILDQAVALMLEGKDDRQNRKVVLKMAEEKETRLNLEYVGAKDIFDAASTIAAEFKQKSVMSLHNEPKYAPIFTPSEISLIEFRINQTQSSNEGAKLKSILRNADTSSAQSVRNLLKTFDAPNRTLEIIRPDMQKSASSVEHGSRPPRAEHGIER
ncbi:MAG: hypothetical protein HS105_05365 [Chloracidobacterium sp.]|nr:hypothetical protein [Chloracidobacterium sp.]